MSLQGFYKRRSFLVFVCLITAATVPGAPAGSVSAQELLPLEELVGRVQERYRTLHDLSARMRQVQTPRPGALTQVEEASWYVRTPGLLRVEYDRTGRLFVAAQEALYWYLPGDHQVQVLEQSALDPGSTPTLYLAGAGDLLEDFRVSGARWQEPLAPANVQIRLDPVREDARFTHLILEIQPDTALIARLVQFGLLGESTDFQFHDIQIDVGLAPELFEFEIPPGAQVEHLGN